MITKENNPGYPKGTELELRNGRYYSKEGTFWFDETEQTKVLVEDKEVIG